MYRGILGSLLYLAASRPNIAFSVGLCARYLTNLRSDVYGLKGYSDVDYARDLVNRENTSGMVQFLGSCLVSCCSKKQNTVALSTAEVEYVAAVACCSKMLWIK